MTHCNDNDDHHAGGATAADMELIALLDAFAGATLAIGFYDEEVAELLRLAVTQLPLRLNRPVLSLWRETRIRQLLDIVTALGLLLGDEDEMTCWLRHRHPRLDWLTPVDFMIDREEGVTCLRRILLQESYERYGPTASRSML